MAGVIDDLESALNEIMRAKNLPISITIVKVGSNDERDSSTLMEKASEVLKTCERSFVNLCEMETFKVQKDQIDDKKFEFNLVKNLPADVEGFFELSKFDLDVS